MVHYELQKSQRNCQSALLVTTIDQFELLYAPKMYKMAHETNTNDIAPQQWPALSYFHSPQHHEKQKLDLFTIHPCSIDLASLVTTDVAWLGSDTLGQFQVQNWLDKLLRSKDASFYYRGSHALSRLTKIMYS